jgi:hypothetical protein
MKKELKTFAKPINKQVLKEAVNKEIDDLQKSWTKLSATLIKLNQDVEGIKELIRQVYNNAPTEAQKVAAKELFEYIKGNLQYTLNNDISKYTEGANTKLAKLGALPSKEEKISVGSGVDTSKAEAIISVVKTLKANNITQGYWDGKELMKHGSNYDSNVSVNDKDAFYSVEDYIKEIKSNPQKFDAYKKAFSKAGYEIKYEYGSVYFSTKYN